MITSEQYRQLTRELKQVGAFRRSDVLGAITMLAELLVLAAELALLIYAAPLSPLFFVAQALLGLSMLRFFYILHETGHGNLFTKTSTNAVVGYASSMICPVPFAIWKRLHFLHHRWSAIIDKDPTGIMNIKMKYASPFMHHIFRILWYTRLPLPSLSMIFYVYWLNPYHEYKKANYRDARIGILSVIVSSIVPISLGLYLGWKDALLYMGPVYFFFLLGFDTINFVHHVGLWLFESTSKKPIPFREQCKYTRSSPFPGALSVLVTYNFNLHTEHHLFPTLPWYRLPMLKRRLKAMGVQYNEVKLLAFMEKLRRKDPIDVHLTSLPDRVPTFEKTLRHGVKYRVRNHLCVDRETHDRRAEQSPANP